MACRHEHIRIHNVYMRDLHVRGFKDGGQVKTMVLMFHAVSSCCECMYTCAKHFVLSQVQTPS